MRNRSRAFRSVVVLVAVLSVCAGCDRVRAGTRCRAGTPPGRDATHVLFCRNGRWVRTLTIGQAAQFVVGNLPGSIESVNGSTATAPSGGLFTTPLRFRVLRRNGRPAGGVNVSVWGAGIEIWGATTDDDGIATLLDGPYAGDGVGTYDLVATVDGTEVTTTIRATNTPARPIGVTVVSGGSQAASVGEQFAVPVVVRVFDTFNHPTPSRRVIFATLGGVSFSPSETMTDENGLARTTMSAGTTPGAPLAAVYVDQLHGEVTSQFSPQIAAGPAASIETVSGGAESRAAGAAFSPLVVRVRDAYGNPTPGRAVAFAAIPNGGATATFASPTAVTDAAGLASAVPTAAGSAGTYTVRATVGSLTTDFSLTTT